MQVSLGYTLHIGLGDLGNLLGFMIAEVISQAIQLVERHITGHLVVGLSLQAGGHERPPRLIARKHIASPPTWS